MPYVHRTRLTKTVKPTIRSAIAYLTERLEPIAPAIARRPRTSANPNLTQAKHQHDCPIGEMQFATNSTCPWDLGCFNEITLEDVATNSRTGRKY